MEKAIGKTIIIDNYDSFTYNLVHIVSDLLGEYVPVVKNDEIDINDLKHFDYFILSPGPGIPDEAGRLKELILHFAPTKKIFGVCLGLQAMGEVFGAKLKNLNQVFHGIKGEMFLTENKSIIFNDIPETFYAGRYHSWVVDTESDLSAFRITARDANNQIMAFDHNSYQCYGVQFHPESIMTEWGSKMLKNFLNS